MIGMIKSRRMRWVRRIARMGVKWKAYRLFLRKPEGEEITRMTKTDLGEVGWGGADWIGLAEDRDR
jgi:hypothetical protein